MVDKMKHTPFEREIFMNSSPSELMCEQVKHTANGNTLSKSDDALLMFHEKHGYFIALHKMGTWAQADAHEIFNFIVRQKTNTHYQKLEDIGRLVDVVEVLQNRLRLTADFAEQLITTQPNEYQSQKLARVSDDLLETEALLTEMKAKYGDEDGR